MLAEHGQSVRSVPRRARRDGRHRRAAAQVRPAPHGRVARYCRGQLDLQACLHGSLPAGRRSQDQGRADDNRTPGGASEVALLGRRQCLVEEDAIGRVRLHPAPDPAGLARSGNKAASGALRRVTTRATATSPQTTPSANSLEARVECVSRGRDRPPPARHAPVGRPRRGLQVRTDSRLVQAPIRIGHAGRIRPYRSGPLDEVDRPTRHRRDGACRTIHLRHRVAKQRRIDRKTRCDLELDAVDQVDGNRNMLLAAGSGNGSCEVALCSTRYAPCW